MIAVIATGSVAMLAALLVIGFQLALRCGGAGSLAGVLFCVLGLGVHVALLACW